MHANAAARRGQQRDAIVPGEGIVGERRFERGRAGREVEDEALTRAGFEREWRGLRDVGARGELQSRGAGVARKIRDLDQTPILRALRGARGVDDAEVRRASAEGPPLHSPAEFGFRGRRVIGEDEHVGLAAGEVVGEREGGVEIGGGRGAFPRGEQRRGLGPRVNGVAERARVAAGEDESEEEKFAVAQKLLQRVGGAGARVLAVGGRAHRERVVEDDDERVRGLGHLPARPGGGEAEEQEDEQLEEEEQRQAELLDFQAAGFGFLLKLPEEKCRDRAALEAIAQQINRRERGQRGEREQGERVGEEGDHAARRGEVRRMIWTRSGLFAPFPLTLTLSRRERGQPRTHTGILAVKGFDSARVCRVFTRFMRARAFGFPRGDAGSSTGRGPRRSRWRGARRIGGRRGARLVDGD